MTVQPPTRKLRWGRVLLVLVLLGGVGAGVYFGVMK